MNVKISVKKLFNMEQLIVSLKEGNKKYREHAGHMFNQNEDLKEKLNEAGCSLKRMDERIQAYQKEADEYKRDIEILSHQLKHTRQVSENWSKSFVEASEERKAYKQEEDAARSAADNL